MAVLRLPIDSTDPHARQLVELEGSTYAIETDWNDRDQAWFCSIYTNEGTALITGYRLVIGALPIRRVVGDTRPPGEIQVVDTAGGYVDPGRDDLGSRVILLYWERETLEAELGG